MERDVDDHHGDDVTVDDVILASSSLSSWTAAAAAGKFLSELKLIGSLAWPTVILDHPSLFLLYFMSMHCNCCTIALFSHLGYYFIKHTSLS